MTRRDRGDGAVYREGERWVARIDLGVGPDGKRRQAKRRAKTKPEAKKLLRELQANAVALDNQSGTRRTVKTAVESFLEVQPAGRSPKTIELEQWRADLIVTGLGKRRISKLTVIECDNFLADAAEGLYGRRPLGVDATRRIRRLLVKVIRNEQRLGMVSENVAELSIRPSAPHSQVGDDEDGDSSNSVHRTLTYAEFQQVWRGARWPLLVLLDLCGRNGLRPSEARALRWTQVDFDQMTLTVNRQMSSDNTPTKAKTKRSVRTIPIDDRTSQILKTWRDKQDAKRERASDRWNDLGLVVSTRYGTGIHASNFRRMTTTLGDEVGVGYLLPYELRHTAITFQIEAGRSSWEVADWAGTSERMIENVYRHRLNRVSQISAIDLPGLDS